MTIVELTELVRTMYKQLHDVHETERRVKDGQGMLLSFALPEMPADDLKRLAQGGIAVMHALEQNIHGQVPEIMVATAVQALVGAYGLGNRRGKGQIYETLGRRARRYIDPLTDETMPDISQLIDAALQQPAIESHVEAAIEKPAPQEAAATT